MSLEVKIIKSFKSFTLSVDFKSNGGSLGLLGASGSGKSMTLRCIAGIDKPDSGKIVVSGKTLFDSKKGINLKPQERKIGFLLQSCALFPHMTVYENITCALKLKKKEKLRRAQEMSALFKLGGLEDRYPSQLSGGQRQRAAMARIFVSEPAALLLDEPFSALDTHLRERLQIELWEFLGGYGGDIVLVSHSRDEIFRLCENMAVLDSGKSLVAGPVKSLFKNPVSLAAARLTGCKNITRANRISENEVFLPDWNLKLEIPPDSENGFSHIGIRAHDFAPAYAGAKNRIAIRVIHKYESPFEWDILFAEKESPACGEIWWKLPKTSETPQIPEFLSISPEKILLLK